ncbi:hypothetical protein [Dehalogenimonas alkenigignens]|uniref:hypothetical protein n=1 Tax=Dehalogenimonas alkenigignens TaxID=1217799 RepID=UPI000D5686FD|nr:hypothetical protein [Dehalogenimonas alkenigignens]PVV83520.1 hypothetical protein DD509_06735 [Dehalogenimonas alkenigignens]
MRRFWSLALAGTILVTAAAPVLASTVTGALYKADITAINTSYDTQRVSVPFTLSTESLIDGLYVDADFDNVALQDAAGNDLAFMPAQGSGDKWMMFVQQIGQNSALNCHLYTGGSTAMNGKLRWFPGDGGMTVNDAADLELGSDFEIEISGYFDTLAGASKNLISKNGAVVSAVSGASEISTTVTTNGNNSLFSSTSDGQIVATGSTYSTVQAAATGTATSNGTTIKIGQEFSATTQSQTNNNSQENLPRSDYSDAYLALRSNAVFTGNITQLKVLLYKYNSPSGTITVNVYSGSTYKGSLGSISATSLTTSPAWYTFSNPVNVTSSDYLYIRLTYSGDGYSSNNYVYWKTNSIGSNAWLADYIWYHSVEEGDGSMGREPCMEITYDPTYTVDRSFLYFDTSSIPDDATITSATIGLYGAIDQSVTDFNLTVTNGQSTYPHDPLQSGDYNKANYSGSGGTLNTSGFTTSGYNTITLDATGRNWINKTGTTKLGVFSSRDIAITTPTGNEYVGVYATDQTGTDKDPLLTVTYTMPAYSSVATGVTSGEHIYKLGLSNGLLTTKIDGITKDTDAVTGSVVNNANNWTFVTNYSMPYVEYIKITVGGVLKGHWYWENDTTFTDQAGSGNTATPTFRTTTIDNDVSATIKAFTAARQSVFSSGDDDAGPEFVIDDDIPPMPSGWYVNLHPETFPGGETITDFLNNNNVPPAIFWLSIAYGGGAIITMLIHNKSKKLLPAALAGILWNVLFGITVGTGLWGLVPIGMISAGEMVNKKKSSY